MTDKRIPRPRDPLSEQERALIKQAVAKKLDGPDFSKLKCEQPIPDTATILLMAKDDEDAKAIYEGTNSITIAP